jgi:spermidine/putrescine-binding protein
VLPLFGTPSAIQDPATCKAADLSAQAKQLIISNWPAYLDPATKKQKNTLEDFEAATGVSVSYTDDVSDNAEFFAKVRNQLGDCQPIGRDMMMLTDWMAAWMIGLGWIQPLDADKVPNLHKNLIKPLQGRQWDKDRTYSAPWQSGLTGIAYNAKLTKEVGSFSDLVTRPDLKGKITLLSEMRDTMAFMLKVVVPEEGLSLWSDNMLVPNKAEHEGNSEKWIDFYYEPEVAAKLSAYVNYICPVEGARDAMVKIDDTLVDNKLIFPSEEDLKDTCDFMVLDDKQSQQYEGEWSDVTGG